MDYLKILLNVYLHIPVRLGCLIVFLYTGICMCVFIKQEGILISEVRIKKWIECFSFGIYMLLVLGATLLYRGIGPEYRYELQLFWSYWETFVNGNLGLLPQMLYNVLIFIPWGIGIPILFTKGRNFKCMIYSALIQSLLIEFLQLVFKCGLFEFDDIFHNVVGALVGFGIWKRYKCRKI